MKKVIVVGAGVSGLTAGYWLMRNGLDVEVFEKEERVGGAVQTLRENGYLFEKGPNSFLDNGVETMELCRELHLENELLKQSTRSNARYIYLNGELHNVPMGPGGLIKTKLLSGKAKRGLLLEIFRSANRSREDESLASFVRRRLGDEILNNLVTPFVSGVYAGDPEKLSLRGTFSILYDLERDHGGLMRGGIARLFGRKKAAKDAKSGEEKKPRARNLCSFVDGMETNTQAIARALDHRLRLQAPVSHIRKMPDGGYVVDSAGESIEAQAVVLAAPSYGAAALLEALAPKSADYIKSIPYNALAVVGMGYPRESIQHECNGFGFLSPRNQGVRILGSIWNSSLFVRRAPGGYRSFSVFIGGGLDPAAIQLSDEEMISQIRIDLGKTVGASGEPDVAHVFRWERAIPQYPIGHVERIEDLRRELEPLPGLFCIGNYLDGVSTNDCIRKAKKTAEEVARFLT
ncbi:MAG: protoporphyrinogen oxidase [Candidatus Omnitrophica bacterium]|nr:protoporphyrinogen oxidase [Candidatus Omnitrophota bacterium]